MRLIKMTGGLGNQMFIYAFYLQMRRRYAGTRIDLSDMAHYDVHNGYELHRVFPQLEAEEVLWPQGLKKVVEFLFFRTVLERKQRPDTLRPFERRRLWPLTYFKGFYQSERHFAGVADEVRRAFTFDEGLAGKRTRALLEQIRADRRAVSLHVRRGDYLEPRTWRNTGCVCGEAYYRDAVERMAQLVEEPHYYVFSDDIAWVRENIPTPPVYHLRGLEPRPRQLAGHDAQGGLPPQRGVQQHLLVVGSLAQRAQGQARGGARPMVGARRDPLHLSAGVDTHRHQTAC